jgi:ferredoxin
MEIPGTIPVVWLTIEPSGRRVPVAPGQSLLEAARAAGLRLRSSCRNGTCRACLCRLVAGEVRYRIDWPGLSAEERAEGLILPCVAVAASDVTIEASGVEAVPQATSPGGAAGFSR